MQIAGGQHQRQLLRPIYLAVQASTAIGDADKVALGVHVKKQRRTAHTVPAESPLVGVTRVDASEFKFVANTGKTKLDVTFGPTVPTGATVWFVAAFFNSRKQMCPTSRPGRATIAAGSMFAAMKLAV